MYTEERPAGTTLLPIGVEGYAGPDYLEFVVGSYYVKLVQSGGKQPSVLRWFADKLAAGLPGTREAPAVLKCFPDRGKRLRAEKLAARDFLGQSFLHDASQFPTRWKERPFACSSCKAKTARRFAPWSSAIARWERHRMLAAIRLAHREPRP